MALKYPEPVVKVVIKDGYQVLEMPDGTIIPKVYWTRVHDACDEPAYVIAKILVNIGRDKLGND